MCAPYKAHIYFSFEAQMFVATYTIEPYAVYKERSCLVLKRRDDMRITLNDLHIGNILLVNVTAAPLIRNRPKMPPELRPQSIDLCPAGLLKVPRSRIYLQPVNSYIITKHMAIGREYSCCEAIKFTCSGRRGRTPAVSVSEDSDEDAALMTRCMGRKPVRAAFKKGLQLQIESSVTEPGSTTASASLRPMQPCAR